MHLGVLHAVRLRRSDRVRSLDVPRSSPCLDAMLASSRLDLWPWRRHSRLSPVHGTSPRRRPLSLGLRSRRRLPRRAATPAHRPQPPARPILGRPSGGVNTIAAYGDARGAGSAGAPCPPPRSPSPLPSPGQGYWTAAADGTVSAFGDARHTATPSGTSPRRSSAWPPPRRATATGWWRPTAASSPSATPATSAPGRPAPQLADRRHGRHPERPRVLAGRVRRRHLHLR